MSSANQNNSFLRTVTSLTLLGGIAASFAWACVSSSSDNKGTGGAAGVTGGSAGTNGGNGGVADTNVGGHATAGGAGSTGGASSTLADCNLGTSVTVVTGNACTPNPKTFTIQDNTAGTAATGTACNIALWAGDGTSSGYFFLPWCNSATANPSDCGLSMACSGGAIHITGTYQASGGTATVDGNAGFGLNFLTTFPDAGPGCQMVGGTGLTGVTLAVTDTTVPGNHLLVGLTLANGNAAEYTANLTAGAQTVNIPWASFKNMKNCGSIPGPGVVGMYFVFDWLNDGAAHTVDAQIGSVGFY